MKGFLTQLLHASLLGIHLLDPVVLGKLGHHLFPELLLFLLLSLSLPLLQLLVVSVGRLQLQAPPQLSFDRQLERERERGGGGRGREFQDMKRWKRPDFQDTL